MLKAQKKLADIERKEQEDKRAGGLKIVTGAVSPDIPEDGQHKGAKKKVKVFNGICFRRGSGTVVINQIIPSTL